LTVKSRRFQVIQIGRWRTASNPKNSLAACFYKKRQKKIRKGCKAFTDLRFSISVIWRFYFYIQGAESLCGGKDFFNWLSANLWKRIYRQQLFKSVCTAVLKKHIKEHPLTGKTGFEGVCYLWQ